MDEDTPSPLTGEAHPEAMRVMASDTSDQRNHLQVVVTGSAVSPVYPPYLRRVIGKTDPTIVPPSTV